MALLPVALVEPDGLIVTTEGSYVRLIECEQVPNTITADGAALKMIEDAFAHLCRLIPDRQSLVIYAQRDPVPIDEALATDRHATRIASAQDRLDGRSELAQARERLLSATTQTVIAAAGAEQPAVAARWWVAVPYRPVIDDARAQLHQLLAGARGRTPWKTHRDAAIESLRLTEQIDAGLRRAGIDTWPLDGTGTLALLVGAAASRLLRVARPRPARRRLPDRDRHHRPAGRASATPDPRGGGFRTGGGDRRPGESCVAAPPRRDG